MGHCDAYLGSVALPSHDRTANPSFEGTKTIFWAPMGAQNLSDLEEEGQVTVIHRSPKATWNLWADPQTPTLEATVPDTGGTTASLQKKGRGKTNFWLEFLLAAECCWKASYISSFVSSFMTSLQPPMLPFLPHFHHPHSHLLFLLLQFYPNW